MDLATNNENVFINNSINYFYNEEQMAVTTFESINFIDNLENYFIYWFLKFFTKNLNWNSKFEVKTGL